MHVLPLTFNGNPNVGLYGVVTDRAVLLGKEVPDADDKKITEVLGLPIIRLNVAGTGLLGVFCLWHASRLLVPHIIFDHERAALEEHDIPYEVVTTDLTCLGNNILVGQKAALLNPEFTEDEQKTISEVLSLPCEARTVMETEALGALGVFRGSKGLFHRDVPPKMVRELESYLGVTMTTGTVNMGNPYVKSGILLGEQGFIIGKASGGPEIVNADEALGFMEDA